MKLSFQTNLEEFNEALNAYQRHSRRTAAEVIAKKGSDLGFRLWKKLRELAPAKGAVRNERLAVLAAGGGIRVRPVARDYARKKTMATATMVRTRKEGFFREIGRTGKLKRNGLSFWQLAVQRELNLRESGRGYLGFSGRFKSMSQELRAQRYDFEAEQKIRDRYTRFISAVGFRSVGDGAAMTFKWGGNNDASNDLARALQKPKARSKIGEALAEARADMMVYIARKMAENPQA